MPAQIAVLFLTIFLITDSHFRKAPLIKKLVEEGYKEQPSWTIPWKKGLQGKLRRGTLED